MRLLFLFMLCFVPNLFFAQAGIVLNSVNGKPVIKHQVQAGETLYFIAKKYNTTVDHLKKYNTHLQQDDIKVNTSVAIYYDKHMLADISQADPDRCIPLLHKVEKGETLFGLAKRMYQLEVADLKLWNRLNSNEISIGQNLIIGWILSDTNYAQSTAVEIYQKQAAEANQQSEKFVETKEPLSEETGRIVYVSKGIQTGELKDLKNSKVYTSPKDPFVLQQKQVDESTSKNEISSDEPVEETETEEEVQNTVEPTVLTKAPAMKTDKRLLNDIFSGFEKDTSGKYVLLKERGAAKWFKPADGSLQLYAMHKTAPIGTILKIANPLNKYTVYVKVIQQLPNTDENQNALLKISSNAMELLKVYDKVFMVDVSYYQQK